MRCRLSNNCGRYFLEQMAVSNIPMVGMSNHSDINATNQAWGT
jgi:hypothetical protein